MTKTIYLITSAVILSTSVFAQNTESGAYAAPVLKYTRLIGQPALITGGKGGWIINKRIALGAGYYVLTTDVNSHFTDDQSDQNLFVDINYGGLEFEYLVFPGNKFNLSFNILLGSGGLNFYLKNVTRKFSTRNLLVWEPQLNFEIELYEWLHTDLGLSYRLISAYKELYDISKNDLQGINILLIFKFGKY